MALCVENCCGTGYKPVVTGCKMDEWMKEGRRE